MRSGVAQLSSRLDHLLLQGDHHVPQLVQPRTHLSYFEIFEVDATHRPPFQTSLPILPDLLVQREIGQNKERIRGFSLLEIVGLVLGAEYNSLVFLASQCERVPGRERRGDILAHLKTRVLKVP